MEEHAVERLEAKSPEEAIIERIGRPGREDRDCGSRAA